jgi:hypothetical protein
MTFTYRLRVLPPHLSTTGKMKDGNDDGWPLCEGFLNRVRHVSRRIYLGFRTGKFVVNFVTCIMLHNNYLQVPCCHHQPRICVTNTNHLNVSRLPRQQQQQPYHHFVGTSHNHLNVITLPPRLFTINIDHFDAFAHHYHHHKHHFDASRRVQPQENRRLTQHQGSGIRRRTEAI